MNKIEILSNLCYHDVRHPDYNIEMDDPEESSSRYCSCDNCFYGRTKLANFILDKLKSIEKEYGQYQFFIEGYGYGSASIAEVNVAYDDFLKALKLE